MLPSFELVANANSNTTKEIRLANKITEILILSVHRFSVFSKWLLMSMKRMEIHNGKNEVK